MSVVLAFPPDDEFNQDHDSETTKQVNDAVTNLNRDDDEWLDWPWPDLTALCGRMAPRDVWFVNAFSGNGKTLFVTSAIHAWLAKFVKVYVMPLETTAEDFRTYLACQAVGIDPGVVNGGGMLDLTLDLRADWQRRILAELNRQEFDRGYREHLKVKGVDAINLPRLKMAAEEAADWGARVLIVDHIDHIGGESKDLYAESTKVNKEAKVLAKRFNLTFLFTSQMNNEAIKGGRDRLAQFGPPMPHHVFMGAHKRMIATGMIGLHRKLRERTPDETLDEYHKALKASRDGDAPPMHALEPNVMAVTAMKLRNFGAREGERTFLRVEHGRVTHLPERDRFQTHYGARQP